MYTVITGAAGFIGSNLVKALNARGETRILAVDDLTQGEKFRNLADCEIADYVDKDEFLTRLADGDFDDDIAAVLHQGACSDTMATDGRAMLADNYRYSVRLLEAPLNVYGYSKFLFDQHVRRMLPERTAQVAGFRYFNVYGAREGHKGRMASVVWHFFAQYRALGKVQLFEGSGGYGAGEQRRDFVSVEDVVKINLDFLDHPERSGIWNLGTGKAATFNAVAAATINACRAADGQPVLQFAELHRAGAIGYVGFPPELAGKYQSFTEADLSRLRAAGYTAPMLAVEEGVPRCVRALLASAPGGA